MSAGFDWTFWLTAALLAALALLLLWHGLWRGRARGRRRCPKCWYDMSASPSLTCSECGFAASREKKLLKSRRRWGAISAGGFAMALAGAIAFFPTTHRHGWVRIVPTTALVLLTPEVETYIPEIPGELERRLHERKVWAWQWRWLLAKTDSPGTPHLVATIKLRERWPEGVPLWCRVSVSASSLLESWKIDESVRVRLVPLFDRSAEPALIRMTSTWDAFARGASPETIARLGTSRAGRTTIDLDLVVELRRGERWVRIYRRPYQFNITISGAIEDYIRLETSSEATEMLRRGLRFDLRSTHLSVNAVLNERVGGGLSAPAVIELLRDGEPVTQWDIWFLGDPRPQPQQMFPFTPRLWPKQLWHPIQMQGDLRPFGTLRYADFNWSLRVRGEPARALVDPDAAAAWAGEFDIPLYLLDHPSISAYQSWIGGSPREAVREAGRGGISP